MLPGLSKSYREGGFELHWFEGPLQRFHGVTQDAIFDGYYNSTSYFDDGWSFWPFPKASEDLPIPLESNIEHFGMLNAWLLAWWPWLGARGHLPRLGALDDLPPLDAPFTGLLPNPDGTLEPGHLSIQRDSWLVILTLETPGARRTLNARPLTWLPDHDYVELQLPRDADQHLWMLDLRSAGGPLFTEQPDLNR